MRRAASVCGVADDDDRGGLRRHLGVERQWEGWSANREQRGDTGVVTRAGGESGKLAVPAINWSF